MEYKYTTTEAVDKALDAEAIKQSSTAEAIWMKIVDADMGTLVRNNEANVKEQLYETYQKASPEDKAAMDAVVLKANP